MMFTLLKDERITLNELIEEAKAAAERHTIAKAKDEIWSSRQKLVDKWFHRSAWSTGAAQKLKLVKFLLLT